MRFGPRYNRLLKSLLQTIERDLLTGGYYPEAEAFDRTRLSHTLAVLDLTLMRPLRTRGRGEESDAKNENLLMALRFGLSAVLNGDIRKPGAAVAGVLPGSLYFGRTWIASGTRGILLNPWAVSRTPG